MKNYLLIYQFFALVLHNANIGLILYHQEAAPAHQTQKWVPLMPTVNTYQHKLGLKINIQPSEESATPFYSSAHQPTFVELEDALLDDVNQVTALTASLSQLRRATIVDVTADPNQVSDKVDGFGRYLKYTEGIDVQIVKLHVGEFCDHDKIESRRAERSPFTAIHICQVGPTPNATQDSNLFVVHTRHERWTFRLTTSLEENPTDLVANATTTGDLGRLATRDEAGKLFGMEITDYVSQGRSSTVSQAKARTTLESLFGAEDCQLNCLHQDEAYASGDFQLPDGMLERQNVTVRCVRCPVRRLEPPVELESSRVEEAIAASRLLACVECVLSAAGIVCLLVGLRYLGAPICFHLAMAIVLLLESALRALSSHPDWCLQLVLVAAYTAVAFQLAIVESQEIQVRGGLQAAVQGSVMFASAVITTLTHVFWVQHVYLRVAFVALLMLIQYWDIRVALAMERLDSRLATQNGRGHDRPEGFIGKLRRTGHCFFATVAAALWLHRESDKFIHFFPLACAFLLVVLINLVKRSGQLGGLSKAATTAISERRDTQV